MKFRVLLVALAAGVLCFGAWWAMRAEHSAPVIERSSASSSETSKTDPGLAHAEKTAERATINASAAAPPQPALAPTHRIVGRVVDEGRFAVAGAQVSLPRGEQALTGGDGAFALEVRRTDEKPARQECLVARDARGRCDFRPLWLTPPPSSTPKVLEVGTLVLAEGYGLSVTVLEAGVPAAGAVVYVELGHARDPLCERQADATGHVALDALPRGPVHLTATLPDRQGHAMVFVPEEHEVAVQLEPLGPIDVIVTDKSTGAGVPDAQLSVSEMVFVPAPFTPQRLGISGEYFTTRTGPGNGSRTDADGRARITGLAQNTRYSLQVDAAGYEHFPTPPASGARLQAGAEPVTVELVPLQIRSVQWPIVAGEVPPPPTGSVITFRHQPGIYGRGAAPPVPTSGRMEGSLLLADDVVGRAYLIAEAPDGSLAELRCEEGNEHGDQAAFRKPRRVEVHIHDQEGHPVVGAQAVARNQGNNEMCEWAASDAHGVAVLARLHGGLAEIHVRRSEENRFGERVGTVDLEQGDASIEAVLAEPTWSRARLTLLVDGVPRLPPQFSVRGEERVRVASEEPASGELLLELANAAPGHAVQIWVSAAGFASVGVTLRFPTDGSEPSERVALERTALLIAHVTPPEEGRVSILPQRLDEQGAWAAGQLGVFNGLTRPNGPDGSYVFSGLTRGRWRVLDERSGASSEPIDVVSVSAPAEVSLDLSSIEWASGRIELDDSAELERVRIRVLDPQAEATKSWRPGSEPPEGAYSRDGTFRIQVPGDREVTLTAWHPWLVPDPEQGSIVLRGGQEDLVLRLVAGDELRIPLVNLNSYVRAIRVARYAGEPTGTVLEWHHVPVTEGVARFAVPKGTWTLWIDPTDGFEPHVLRDVAVDGVTELQPLELARGSSVRVRILVPKDQSTPRIGVFASSIDEPEYGRGMNSDGEEVAVLSGLAAGRFKLSFSSVMGREASVEKEIELDGVHDLELEYDLR